MRLKAIILSTLMMLFCGLIAPSNITTNQAFNGSFIATVEAAHHGGPRGKHNASLGRHDMSRVQRHYHHENMRVSRHHYDHHHYRHYSYVSPTYWYYDRVPYYHGRYRGYWHGRRYCMHSEDWIRLVGLATFASLINNNCVVLY